MKHLGGQFKGIAVAGHQVYVASMALSPDGKILASAGIWDETIILWDVDKLQALKSSP